MNTGAQIVSPDNTFPEVDDRLFLAVKAIIVWLQGIYKTRPVGSYRWDADPEQTEIVITAHDPYDAAKTNKRPNIVVARNGASYMGTSMGQVSRPMFAGDVAEYSDVVRTGIVITVIAREGLEAQGIAYTLFRLVPIFRGMLNRAGHMTVAPHQMSVSPEMPWVDVAQGSSAPHRRAIVVSLPISIQDTFSVDAGKHHAFLHAIEQHVAASI